MKSTNAIGETFTSNNLVATKSSVPDQGNRLLGIYLILIFFLLPMYVLPSGGFQLVDGPLVLFIILVFIGTKNKDRYLDINLLPLVLFVIWVILVAGGYYMTYQITEYLKGAAAIVFGFVSFYTFTIFFSRILRKGNLIYLYIALLFSIIGCFVIKGHEFGGERAVLSFNNPNQLGLFAVILYSFVIILLKYKITNNISAVYYYIIDLILILAVHYLAALAVSRAGMAAMLILDICLLKNITNKRIFGAVASVLVIAAGYLMFINPSFIEQRIEARQTRRFTKGSVETDMASRVAPLTQMTAWELLIGKGMGGPTIGRGGGNLFASRSVVAETHNMFGWVVEMYGLVGLAFYLFWIWKFFWRSRVVKDATWIWAAILVYSISGVVIRFRSFWILLGLLAAMVSIAHSKEKSLQQQTFETSQIT